MEQPMLDDLKSMVKTQFGASADAYATSKVHAQGESLAILAELITPQSDWQALDVATGAGHTALMFAPYVARMVATDLTEQMVDKAAELARQQGLTNMETRQADAESLPFDDQSFDLVTCRIALHHFPVPQQAINEFARVLKPSGLLGFTDNVTVTDMAAAGYYNAYEKLRDPSHYWAHSTEALQTMFEQAGLTVKATRRVNKEMVFQAWADRMQVSDENKTKLLYMMANLPEALEPMLQPRWGQGCLGPQKQLLVPASQAQMWFTLWDWVCVAEKVEQ
ncbi:class I SAM-dependent methyltransferase [Anaerolineales bacterium HSG6]|nr:class I SAM-dependent methyltransferase [Anaerolineales bacterium HSG6]